ncbi:MAG: quinol:electron acceptor oxidoreductase subunit ActD [Planctomycetaceae bacterium]|nr:quinol:electron acceptor oxidoreductase subunit ActD [Planctomycetaceae bacterium]
MTSILEEPLKTETTEATKPQRALACVLAEYDSPQAVAAAARQVMAAGYTRVDAHAPFPFHELDAALAIGKSRLPWMTLGAAAIGGASGLLREWWMNAVDYQFLISGKPLLSMPSNMPVVFACAVLFAAITTLVGMLLLNGLPRFSNPLLRSERFRRATNDRFFISVDARDRRFNLDAVTSLLQSSGALAVEECWTDRSGAKIPPLVWQGALVALALLCIPPAIIARMRATDSRVPRFHLIQDMDFQPKFKPQSTNAFFADGRADRPQLPGTIARGDLQDDDRLHRGLDSAEPIVAAAPPPAAPGAPAPDPLDAMPWVAEFPISIDVAVMKRGQERFNIYCSTCHGLGGDGDGLITQRALELEQGTWVKPVSFHTDAVRKQPVGRLFHSITNGVRKMPPMGDLIPVEDRWAILLYVRALQRSRNASVQDVPADLLPQLEAQ